MYCQKGFYNPGFTQNLRYYGRASEELMIKVYIDLETLEKHFRWLSLNDEKILRENEYLIKTFYAPPNEKLPPSYFHFIRQAPQTRLWFHKMEYDRQPDILPIALEYNPGNVGSKPATITCWLNNEFVFVCNPVGYFYYHRNFTK